MNDRELLEEMRRLAEQNADATARVIESLVKSGQELIAYLTHVSGAKGLTIAAAETQSRAG